MFFFFPLSFLLCPSLGSIILSYSFLHVSISSFLSFLFFFYSCYKVKRLCSSSIVLFPILSLIYLLLLPVCVYFFFHLSSSFCVCSSSLLSSLHISSVLLLFLCSFAANGAFPSSFCCCWCRWMTVVIHCSSDGPSVACRLFVSVASIGRCPSSLPDCWLSGRPRPSLYGPL